MHILQICRVLGPANWNNSPGYHTTYFHPIPWHNGKHYNSRPFGQSSLSISGAHTILWTRLRNKFLQKFIPKDLPSIGQAGRVWLQHLVQCVRWPVLDPDDLVGFWNALERTLQSHSIPAIKPPTFKTYDGVRSCCWTDSNTNADTDLELHYHSLLCPVMLLHATCLHHSDSFQPQWVLAFCSEKWRSYPCLSLIFKVYDTWIPMLMFVVLYKRKSRYIQPIELIVWRIHYHADALFFKGPFYSLCSKWLGWDGVVGWAGHFCSLTGKRSRGFPGWSCLFQTSFVSGTKWNRECYLLEKISRVLTSRLPCKKVWVNKRFSCRKLSHENFYRVQGPCTHSSFRQEIIDNLSYFVNYTGFETQYFAN